MTYLSNISQIIQRKETVHAHLNRRGITKRFQSNSEHRLHRKKAHNFKTYAFLIPVNKNYKLCCFNP